MPGAVAVGWGTMGSVWSLESISGFYDQVSDGKPPSYKAIGKYRVLHLFWF
jgi:hypothetical protein